MQGALRLVCLGGVIAVTVAPSAGAAEVSAPSMEAIRAVVRARKGEIAGCYRREQPRLPVVSGRIDVRWQILSTGRVAGTTTVTDTIGSPDLDQCLELAVARWTFSRFSFGTLTVTMPFAFTPAGVTFGHSAETVSAVPNVDAGALRAVLLRFGPNFVSVGCVAGKRSFLGTDCEAAIRRAPRIGASSVYAADAAAMDVHPASLRFEHARIDVDGFAIAGWPRAPAGANQDAGAFDGFGVWPPATFSVELTPYGKMEAHNGVVWRCQYEPWSPCRAADRPRDGGAGPGGSPNDWPLAKEPVAREVRRLLAPTMRRFDAGWKLRLGQTLSLDIDGDGKPETLHNFAATEVLVSEPRDRGKVRREDVYIPTEFFFIFAERGGNLVRIPVETVASLWDGMDGAILGWLDIDGDGRPEIWIDTPRFEGRTWQLVRFRDGAFRPVADFAL